MLGYVHVSSLISSEYSDFKEMRRLICILFPKYVGPVSHVSLSPAFSLKRKLQSHAKGGSAYMDLPAVAEELSLHRCPEVYDILLPKCLDHETGHSQAKHFSRQLLPSNSADATLELAAELSDFPNLASRQRNKDRGWIFIRSPPGVTQR
ncbi:MAG: hypothetical protein RDU76_05395 [Candidatus Edwardsbacteria bacterium]|nr:hypothetical protein [Candidatus Edwardsbacteria bacterium]